MRRYTWRDDQESRARRLVEAAGSGRIQSYGQLRDWALNVLALKPSCRDYIIRTLTLAGLVEFVQAIRDQELGQQTLAV